MTFGYVEKEQVALILNKSEYQSSSSAETNKEDSPNLKKKSKEIAALTDVSFLLFRCGYFLIIGRPQRDGAPVVLVIPMALACIAAPEHEATGAAGIDPDRFVLGHVPRVFVRRAYVPPEIRHAVVPLDEVAITNRAGERAVDCGAGGVKGRGRGTDALARAARGADGFWCAGRRV